MPEVPNTRAVRKPRAAKPKAQDEVKRLGNLLRVAEAKLLAMQFERDFWVEQARNLQNHLQTVMRGQAGMLEQMARTSMTTEDVQDCCKQIATELRQPLTSVEATRALSAAARVGTQGHYTPVRRSGFVPLKTEVKHDAD